MCPTFRTGIGGFKPVGDVRGGVFIFEPFLRDRWDALPRSGQADPFPYTLLICPQILPESPVCMFSTKKMLYVLREAMP